MSLADKIQQAWAKQSAWLVLLRPLSWLYRAVFLAQKNSKQKTAYRAPVPVMIIGNITVGGSGKTPLIIHLVKYLQQQNIKVGVISRGYGGQGVFPALVASNAQASQVGDEPVLIVQHTQVPMVVGPNRQQAIELLLKNHAIDLILSDDGLQHFALARDIEWVVVDAMRGFGNEKLLPEGYLREPLARLNETTVIEHHVQPKTELNMHLQAGQPFCLGNPSPQIGVQFDDTVLYHAVVGIGYPQRFFKTLEDLHIQFEPHIFPDHHQYSLHDLQDLLHVPIITTSKDAVKLQELFQGQAEYLNQIWVVPVEAKLSDFCYNVLNQQLKSLNLPV